MHGTVKTESLACVSETATPQSRRVMFGCSECARKYIISALEFAATGAPPTGLFQMLAAGKGRGKPDAGRSVVVPWPVTALSFVPAAETASTSYEYVVRGQRSTSVYVVAVVCPTRRPLRRTR